MVKVRDIMQRDLVTVRPEATIRELVRVLTARGISGAPVVDDRGSVVGVVSAGDVLRFAASDLEIPVGDTGRMDEEGVTDASEGDGDVDHAFLDYFLGGGEPLGAILDLNSLSDSGFDRVQVRDVMTPAIFRVRADASLHDLARFLTCAGIHRALVMERGRLAGLVSAMDVVRAVSEEAPAVPAEAGAAGT
jgi:CBS domain-containing protein